MKLYRTRTREEYDFLMQKLEDEGYEWKHTRDKPTEQDYFFRFGDRVIRVDRWDKTITQGLPENYEEPIIEVSELMKVDPLAKKIEERNNKPTANTGDPWIDNLPEEYYNPTPRTKTEKHRRLLDNLHNTYINKNKDYGDAFGKSHEKYGAIAGLTRINDKFNRLEELILSGEQLVEDETVLDTLLDLANYAIMFAMELEEEE